MKVSLEKAFLISAVLKLATDSSEEAQEEVVALVQEKYLSECEGAMTIISEDLVKFLVSGGKPEGPTPLAKALVALMESDI